MKTLLTLILLLSAPLAYAAPGGIEFAKAHVRSTLMSDHKKLEETYAPKVTLMPGHEFLKEKYGLAGPGARGKGAEVERGKLIAAIARASSDRPGLPEEHVKRILSTLKYQSMKVHEGDFETEASDPVETPHGKLHFTIRKGDLLIKVSPPKGDFILLHLRMENGAWKVVSEYLD